MKVLFACNAPAELEVFGTGLEWEAFSLAVQQHGSEIPCEKVDDPAPYSRSLQRIVVLHIPNQKVEFRIEREVDLQIVGDRQLMEKLAATANNFGRDFENGSHVHIEYQGEGHMIGKDSIPAVFAR